MVAMVEGILGLKPTPTGITINPSIPSQWKQWSMTKKLRGKTLNIEVLNPHGNQNGVKSVTVNAQKLDGSYISDELLKDVNDIVIEM